LVIKIPGYNVKLTVSCAYPCHNGRPSPIKESNFGQKETQPMLYEIEKRPVIRNGPDKLCCIHNNIRLMQRVAADFSYQVVESQDYPVVK